MPAKKKKGKKGKKGGKKKVAEGDEETKNENEELKVSLPTFGWIKITVSNLCTIYFKSCKNCLYCIQLMTLIYILIMNILFCNS